MTRCFFQSHVRKNTHRHKGCDWLTIRKYYGSTSTKKLSLIIIGFDTPTNNNGNKNNNILAIASLASDTNDAGKGGGEGSCNCHRRLPKALAMKTQPPPPPAIAKDVLHLHGLVAAAPTHNATKVCCPIFLDVAPLQDRHARVHPAGHLH
jgi:hypothetical protein